jgi:hypothetical protein
MLLIAQTGQTTSLTALIDRVAILYKESEAGREESTVLPLLPLRIVSGS